MIKFIRPLLPGLLALGLFVGASPALATAGVLDPTFGNGGVTVTRFGSSSNLSPSAVKVQSDGSVLVLVINVSNPENVDSEVLRYTSTGELDKNFGNQGRAAVIGGTMSLQSNGQTAIGTILTDPTMALQALAVQRLNADGTKDTTFGKGGMAIADVDNRAPVFDIVLAQPEGDIMMCLSLEPLGGGSLPRLHSRGLLPTVAYTAHLVTRD